MWKGILAACPHLSKDAIHALLGTLTLPSASTLSKRQIQLDASLCLHWRQFFAQQDHAFYVWADSSPQAGEDYLMSMMLVVPSQSLLQVMDACHTLWKSVPTLHNAASIGDKMGLSQAAAARHQASIILDNTLQVHRQIPTALGHAAADVDHKTRLLCHKFLVEAQNPQHAVHLMHRVIAFCVDLGVEACMPNVCGSTAKMYLESWHCSENVEGEIASDGESDIRRPEPGAVNDKDTDGAAVHKDEYLLPNAMVSPGMLHIMDSSTNNMATALPSFPEWIVPLKALARLLGTKHLRARYLEKCLVGRHQHFSVLFQRKFPKIAKWRWGTMYKVLSMLLPLKEALRHTWNADAFLGEKHSNDTLHAQSGDHLDTKCITAAVGSAWFWAYAHMMHSLHDWSNAIAEWSESCPCHGWIADAEQGVLLIEHSQASSDTVAFCLAHLSEDKDGPKHRCPLAGKRVVELASGEFSSYMKHLRDMHTLHLMPHCVDLLDAQLPHLIAEYKAGLARLEAGVLQKLQNWSTLPWKLCGMGHADPEIARSVASWCIQDFDRSCMLALKLWTQRVATSDSKFWVLGFSDPFFQSL